MCLGNSYIDKERPSNASTSQAAKRLGEARRVQRDFSPAELARWRNAILNIYERMREKARLGPYDLQCDTIALTVLPNVYAPRFFTDSLWFAQHIPEVVGRGSLLEVGTGVGLIAIACARNGARVVATDINPDAAANARLNIARHHLDIRVIGGNLFDEVARNEKFDYIFWAHPFNNWEAPVLDMLLRSGMDYHYEGLRGYVAGAHRHLTPNGKLLLGTGDSADLGTVSRIAAEHGFQLELLNEAQMPLEEQGDLLIRYLIYEFARVGSKVRERAAEEGDH
jgi:SAM-dependent methyltransferase